MGRFLNWIKGRGAQTFHLDGGDIVVFVVGPTGSGKSSFVREVTKSVLFTVGENLQPCTGIVQAVRCELTEEAKKALKCATQNSIVFVDTPSFNTARDDDAEGKMTKWLSDSQCKSTLAGIIYLHRIETEPSLESIQSHLKTFTSTLPRGFACPPNRLRAVLSHLDGKIPNDKIQSRKDSFLKQLGTLPPSLRGTQAWITSHPDFFGPGDSETAWQAVVALFSHDVSASSINPNTLPIESITV